MNKSIAQDQISTNCPSNSYDPEDLDNDEWVAIRDNFPSLSLAQIKYDSSEQTEKINLTQNTYKFEVESKSDPNLYILYCRKVELKEIKKIKLQPRFKNGSQQDREISQEFEFIDVHSEELSIERMKNAHKILQELYGSVTLEIEDELKTFPSFPNLSLPSYGLWTYIAGSHWEPSVNCKLLEEYYTCLFAFCPLDMFMEIIFTSKQESNQSECIEDNRLEKYEECFSELNRNTYQSNIKKYRCTLEILEQKKSTLDIRTIEELLEYYCELDDVFYFLERSLSDMFLYESQPFADGYQISIGERDRLRNELSDPSIADELSDEDFIEMCERERLEEDEVLKSSARIHELTIYHLQELAQLIESQLEQGRLDKEVCPNLWDTRAEMRLQKLEAKLNNLLINLLSVQIECLQDAKERNILSIVSMEETENFSERLKKKESTVFTVESQLIDIKLRLIEEQENMYKHRMTLFENDKESQELIRKKMDKLGRKKARLRTKQRLVKNAQTEAGKEVSSAATKLQTVLEDSFYSQLVIQKRKDANCKVAANKYDRIKKERVKTIERIKQKISENPKEERKLPPSYLPPSQRTGTILDTKNKKTKQTQQQQPQTTQPMSRLRKLNITPSMAHHYPSIDSSLSISVSASNSEQKPIVKKLQTRTFRGNINNNMQRNRSKQKQDINTTSRPTKKVTISKYNIPDPPPDIPNEYNKTSETSQNLTDIINARKNLPKDLESTLIPTNPHDSMMKIIRSGVKLRPSRLNNLTKMNSNASLSDGAHASLLKAVASISLSTQDSDSDTPDAEDSNW